MQKSFPEIFKECGLSSLFSSETCNLKTMTPDSLFVSNLYHSSVVSITEEGVEAAAATGFKYCKMSMPFQFRADRPFIFIIYETVLEIPLFLNAVYCPTEE